MISEATLHSGYSVLTVNQYRQLLVSYVTH